jgi:hypothetical protein
LIGMYLGGDAVKLPAYRRRRFVQRYTRVDVGLLAGIDEVHGTLSGPATRKLLERACHNFGEAAYQRLAWISVAQLYRLRGSRVYRQRHIAYQATRPTAVSIGKRRKPEPLGRPGYLRVDTVHQGDQDGAKGVYHINAVDEVTQWQVLGAVAQIGEAWLMLHPNPRKPRRLPSLNRPRKLPPPTPNPPKSTPATGREGALGGKPGSEAPILMVNPYFGLPLPYILLLYFSVSRV